MDKMLDQNDELRQLKTEVRELIEAFISGYRAALGNITPDLEQIEKDLVFFTDENSANKNHAEIYKLLTKFILVTSKTKEFILDKLKPSDLDMITPENNPLLQSLLLFIETPEFKALDEAKEKILLIQCTIAPHYCNEILEKLLSQTPHHHETIHRLREDIADIAAMETHPTEKVSKIRDKITEHRVQSKSGYAKILGIFTYNNHLFESALDSFIRNLPEDMSAKPKKTVSHRG